MLYFCVYVQNKNVVLLFCTFCVCLKSRLYDKWPDLLHIRSTGVNNGSKKTGSWKTGKSCDKGLPGGLLGRRTEQVRTNVFFHNFSTLQKKVCLGVALLTEKAPKGPRTGSRLTSCRSTFLSSPGRAINQDFFLLLLKTH